MITTAMNKVLLDIYKEEKGLPQDLELYVYGTWITKGYRPKKGEFAKHRAKLWTSQGLIPVWLWEKSQCEKTEEIIVNKWDKYNFRVNYKKHNKKTIDK